MKIKQIAACVTGLACVLAVFTLAHAGVANNLPYPGKSPSAEEIISNVYFVNHFFALKNVSIEMEGKTVTVIIYKSSGEKPTTNTVKRYLNNDYNDGVVRAKDLAIFTSGKERGMGLLVTDYVEDDKSQSYQIWMPELRKVRLFSQPSHIDAWGGTDFSFGDVTLRKPFHETHEIIEQTTFQDCLTVMQVAEEDRNWYMKSLPNAPVCDHKGKPVYVVKSKSKFPEWGYDYRLSYIDTKTFGDYRTEYFKDGKKYKVIDRDWGTLDMPDPRALYWKFWYGKNLESNHETMAIVPKEVFRWNTDKKAELWSEETLTQIHR